MEELIYLESDEEIPSVIDKIKSIDSDPIGLVIPKGSALIQSVVNLKLLKKQSEELHKNIVIISQDKVGRNLAAQIGLVVYDSVSAERPVAEISRPEIPANDVIEIDLSEKKPVATPKGLKIKRYDELEQANNMQGSNTFIKRSINIEKDKSTEIYPEKHTQYLKQKPKNTGKKWLVFLSILILAATGMYFFYPKATVGLSIKSEPFEKNIDITLDNNINKVDQTKLAMPGDLQEVTAEESKKFDTTGKKEVGEKATGTITVYNEWDSEAHSFPMGAKFTASGKVFLANSAFTVPAGVLSGGKIQAGTVDIFVIAESAGDSYNIGATTFVLDGAPTKIYGKSAKAMSGGQSKQITIVTNDDLNRAKEDLKSSLSQKNKDEIVKKADKQKIIESSIENDVVSFSADKKDGDEANQFNATLKLRSRTISFSEADYKELLTKSLAQYIPQDKELVLSGQDEVSVSNTQNDFSQGIMKLSGTIKTKLASKIDVNSLKNNLSGKNKEQAESYLKSITGIEKVDLTFRPTWWQKIPKYKNNIVFNLNYK